VSLPPFAGDRPRIANKEVVVFIRANAVTRSDQASTAALCVAAFPVIWLHSIEVPGCAVRHGTTATRLGERFSHCRGWFWGGNNPTEAQMNGLIYLIGLIVVILAILSFFGLR
jgi:hypothetical protein